MEEDLTQQLRSPFAEERRAAAEQLAKWGTDAAIESLIALADAGTALDDQLLAIEFLGDTRSPRASTYVEGLCCDTIVEIPSSYTWTRGEELHEVTCLDEGHVSLNAQGPLRFALTYVVQLYEVAPDGGGVRRRPEADVAAEREKLRGGRARR